MIPAIVYLDDEEFLCDIFKEYVEHLGGFSVRTFTKTVEALESCKSEPPDIMLIDYRLEDTTGDKIVSEVGEDVFKVLVTGELSISRMEGFDTVLKKPYSFAELKDLLSSRL